MNYLLWASAFFIAFLLQVKISLLSVSPNITALLAYYIGIKYGQNKGVICGLLIGAIEDSLSAPILGPNMLGKGLVGFSSAFFISGGIFVWTPLLGMLGLALLTVIDNSVVFLSLSIFDKTPTNPASALFITIMQALLNSAAGMVIKPAHAD
ncbi:MAG: rod shape-determining protein MreD [Nitrospirae bacterium]|nr:rod shape-determining protein MreD [Nitrospirota bacterium]